MIMLRNLLMIVCVLLVPSGIQGQGCPNCAAITPENAADLELLHVLGDGIARDLAWSAGGEQLAVASTNGVFIFDAANPLTPISELAVSSGAARVIASPNGWIAGTGDGTVMLLNPELILQQPLTGHIYPITTLELGDQTFISVDQSGVARQWSSETMAEERIFQTRGDGRGHIAALNPTRDLIAYMGIPETGGVYLSPDSQAVGVFTVPFASVSFGEGGSVIGLGEEGGIFQWALGTLDDPPLVSLSAPPALSLDAVSVNGDLQAQGRSDGTIRLLDANGAQLAILRGFIRGITAVAFSPDAALLAAASLDGTARLYDTAAVLSAASPDDPALAGLVVLDQERGGHTLGVTGVAFNDAGTMLATSSFDGTIRLWGLAD